MVEQGPAAVVGCLMPTEASLLLRIRLAMAPPAGGCGVFSPRSVPVPLSNCLPIVPCTCACIPCCPAPAGSGLQPLDSVTSVNSATGLRTNSAADPADSADTAKLHDAAASDSRLLNSASRLALWIMVSRSNAVAAALDFLCRECFECGRTSALCARGAATSLLALKVTQAAATHSCDVAPKALPLGCSRFLATACLLPPLPCQCRCRCCCLAMPCRPFLTGTSWHTLSSVPQLH